MNPPEVDASYGTVKSVARAAGVPVAWLKAEVLAGRVPALRIGRRLLLNFAVVNAALAARAGGAAIVPLEPEVDPVLDPAEASGLVGLPVEFLTYLAHSTQIPTVSRSPLYFRGLELLGALADLFDYRPGQTSEERGLVTTAEMARRGPWSTRLLIEGAKCGLFRPFRRNGRLLWYPDEIRERYAAAQRKRSIPLGDVIDGPGDVFAEATAQAHYGARRDDAKLRRLDREGE